MADPILLETMRRHPEAEVRVEWNGQRMGTTARGFVAEYDDAVAAARAEVLAKVEALADSLTPPVNCELRYDGSTDTHMAAWVEGRLDAIDALRALVADLGGDHG